MFVHGVEIERVLNKKFRKVKPRVKLICDCLNGC